MSRKTGKMATSEFPESSDRWEYKRLHLGYHESEDVLNQYGEAGWEVCGQVRWTLRDSTKVRGIVPIPQEGSWYTLKRKITG